MKELLQKSIELLKIKVQENLLKIKSNQILIENVLKLPPSRERDDRFQYYYDVNKKLLSENNDFINLQLTLVNFTDKYPDWSYVAEARNIKRKQLDGNQNDLLVMTVTGEMPYDEYHPMFYDQNFFRRLMEHFEGKENYEMCQELLYIRRAAGLEA